MRIKGRVWSGVVGSCNNNIQFLSHLTCEKGGMARIGGYGVTDAVGLPIGSPATARCCI